MKIGNMVRENVFHENFPISGPVRRLKTMLRLSFYNFCNFGHHQSLKARVVKSG
jgi:hypothetical protein